MATVSRSRCLRNHFGRQLRVCVMWGTIFRDSFAFSLHEESFVATVSRFGYLRPNFWIQFRVLASKKSVFGDSFALVLSAEQFLATVARIRSLIVKMSMSKRVSLEKAPKISFPEAGLLINIGFRNGLRKLVLVTNFAEDGFCDSVALRQSWD